MPKFDELLKNNAIALDCWRYFLMEFNRSNKRIINDIMYSQSIKATPPIPTVS